VASDHSSCILRILASVHDGRITVYQAADLSALLLRPVCLRPASCTSAMMELMPCATHSRLWCGFDADSSRLPSPFPSLLISVARLPLLSLVSRYVISILLLFCCHRQYCFSISSLRPSSLSGPSPCILPAGAYWFLWKVRCSKPLLILCFSGNHRRFGRTPYH